MLDDMLSSRKTACRIRPVFKSGILVTFIFLFGCATSAEDNDPSEGGFVRAVKGVSGGQYEERQRRQEEQLARERELSDRLDRRHLEITRNQAALDREIESFRKKVAGLQSRIGDARQALMSTEGENRELAESLDAAENRLTMLTSSAKGGDEIDFDNVDRIMAEIEEIELLVVQLTADVSAP